MNLILFSDSDLISDNTIKLTDHRFMQIGNVHRSKRGDSVRVGKINGLMGTGIIQSIDDQTVEIDFQLTDKPPEKLPLTIVLALPRPKMLRRIFRTTAELGVEKLILINSAKVEKSYWSTPALNDDNIHNYLLEGLQQAKDTILPSIELEKLFKPFVEDKLPKIIDGSTALVAHPNLGMRCPREMNHKCTLAIGPEGGFVDYEIDKFLECGFDGIHLGQRILKVETAFTTLISKLY